MRFLYIYGIPERSTHPSRCTGPSRAREGGFPPDAARPVSARGHREDDGEEEEPSPDGEDVDDGVEQAASKIVGSDQSDRRISPRFPFGPTAPLALVTTRTATRSRSSSPSRVLSRCHPPPRPRHPSRLTASNPDVTAPLSVSLEHPHGQCSLLLYIRAFHRVGVSPRVYTFLLRWRAPGRGVPRSGRATSGARGNDDDETVETGAGARSGEPVFRAGATHKL